MLYLGLKGSFRPKQLYDRLKYQPDIIEFYLREEDLFGNNRKELEKAIELLLRMNIKVFLHHPSKYNGKFVDIINEDVEIYEFYHFSARVLYEICKKYNIKCVIHPNYVESEATKVRTEKNTKRMFNEIKKILEYSEEVFLWENSIDGLFTSSNPKWYEDFVEPLNLPIAFDISHTFISYKGDNNKLLEEIKKFRSHIKYFHLVDSSGERHDGLELGQGKIDWKRILPYILGTPYIYEIQLSDADDASQMYNSHLYLKNIYKKIKVN